MGGESTITRLRRDAVEIPDLRVTAETPAGVVQASLELAPLVVGSHGDCDLRLDDEQASRRHCVITLDERGVRLRDLGSKNGTYVRGVRVIEAPLELGEPVTVGRSRLIVGVAGAPAVVPLSVGASFGEALGGSLAMRALFARLERVAATEATVVLRGESGTGKELLARAIHAASPRRDGPFEVLDCAAVAPELFESELFGHARGAFTGAERAREGVFSRAHGGTLFIDELGELPPVLQPKLLRALESRQVRPIGSSDWQGVDVRTVCATHADLEAGVASGAFRQDLYFRLAMVQARVPPLRERKDDIPLLVERYLAAQTPPRGLDDLAPSAMPMLLAHDWPGNVRELHNTVARLVLLAEVEGDLGRGGDVGRLPLREARALAVEQFERRYLADRLREHGGNVSRTAEAIGVSRQMLHRLLDRHAIGRGS